MASATSYGVFLEMNPTGTRADAEVFTNSYFISKIRDFENTGPFFNPVIPVNQIAGSRLLMGCAIAKLRELGHEHYYMDTDSLFVPNEVADKLSSYFDNLNPYSFGGEFLEVEKKDMMFYGICSKRYVLFKREKGKNIINQDRSEKEYKLHGLGHILNPFGKDENWHISIWQDILDFHYNSDMEEYLHDKYNFYYPISKQTLSTPRVYKFFNELNKDQPFNKQIKPFNFILVGQSTDKDNCKPIAPFTKYPQSIVRDKFINAKYDKKKSKPEFTREMQGSNYWLDMNKMFFKYLNQPETKFENGTQDGRMKRREVFVDGFEYIGKEVKNINDLLSPEKGPSVILNEKEYIEKILSLSPEERRKLGISRQRYFYWKKKAEKGEIVKKGLL